MVVPVLFDNDIDGAATKIVANKMTETVNVRVNEGDGENAGFARKAQDETSSKRRPGGIYIVPTRFETIDDFKVNYASYYYKKKELAPGTHDTPGVRKKWTSSGIPRKKQDLTKRKKQDLTKKKKYTRYATDLKKHKKRGHKLTMPNTIQSLWSNVTHKVV